MDKFPMGIRNTQNKCINKYTAWQLNNGGRQFETFEPVSHIGNKWTIMHRLGWKYKKMLAMSPKKCLQWVQIANLPNCLPLFHLRYRLEWCIGTPPAQPSVTSSRSQICCIVYAPSREAIWHHKQRAVTGRPLHIMKGHIRYYTIMLYVYYRHN